jgi:N-acetylglucosamine-6-phosphate deacetylase
MGDRGFGRDISMEAVLRITEVCGLNAGSALDMAAAVRNTVQMLGLPLDEAVRMASTWPAEFLGLGASRGRIAAGCRADLVAMDDALRVQQSWIGGEERGEK